MERTCSICNQSKNNVWRNRQTGKLACDACSSLARYYDFSTHEECSECGRVRHVARRKLGKPICPSCYYYDSSTHEECSRCKRVRHVARRISRGQPLCQVCYQLIRVRARGICVVCGQKKVIQKNRRSGNLICRACYKRSRISQCAECKEVKIVKALGLCSACYNRGRYHDPSTHKKCSRCEEVKPAMVKRQFGKPICQNCYYKDISIHRKCSRCGKIKYVKARTDSGKPICKTCYQRGKVKKVGQCIKCKKTKIIQALGLCYTCYQRQRRVKAVRFDTAHSDIEGPTWL